jgi:hypothetical protein
MCVLRVSRQDFDVVSAETALVIRTGTINACNWFATLGGSLAQLGEGAMGNNSSIACGVLASNVAPEVAALHRCLVQLQFRCSIDDVAYCTGYFACAAGAFLDLRASIVQQWGCLPLSDANIITHHT